MSQQVVLELDPKVQQQLVEIPTATTFGERQLALHYLASQWDGTGSVFENGTLLGGATRALAMGMMFNEKRSAASRLYTFDWFSLAQPLDLPDDIWDQLTSTGFLLPAEVRYAQEQGTFLPLFEALHRDSDYWPLVFPEVGYLPGYRDEVAPDGARLFRAPDREFSVAFVDGCKSWYGTKHWFRELAPHLRPGADLMFQDFGHYTCFWISSLIGMFCNRFELIAFVDHTYIWRLTDEISPEDVDDFFPDEPTDFDRAHFDRIYDGLLRDALERGDRYAAMAHQMHRAAAYSYLGLLEEAREILDGLLMVLEWFPYRNYLKAARVSPTYRPEGRIKL